MVNRDSWGYKFWGVVSPPSHTRASLKVISCWCIKLSSGGGRGLEEGDESTSEMALPARSAKRQHRRDKGDAGALPPLPVLDQFLPCPS